jgi:hypothetical protein
LSRSFNDFLQQAARDKSDGYPKALDDLSKAGIRLVIADSNDPDSVGFVQWRVSFYVAGDDGSVLNFMSLFDDYLVWKAKAMAKDIETHIFAHTGVDELDQAKIEEELNYEHYKARLCNECVVLVIVRCLGLMSCRAKGPRTFARRRAASQMVASSSLHGQARRDVPFGNV